MNRDVVVTDMDTKPVSTVHGTVSRRRFLVLLGAGAVALAACTTGPLPVPYPPIRFTDQPPYRLAVSAIDVVDSYRPPLAAPNVDHLFPMPPLDAVHAWAGDRLIAAEPSSPRRARLSVLDASVVEQPLKRSGGLKALVTREPSENLVGHIAVMLEIVDGDGTRLAYTKVEARRTRGVLEDVSLKEREDIYDAMARAMMADVDAQLSANIERYFGPFILP